ncbi:MAG: 3'(2'),5'-bisphosphate nucleotidase CysQ [Gammaproteobacteria bacterium]
MTQDLPLADWLESVRNIAEQAGGAIMEIYGRDFAVGYKDDESPLTEADLAAHKVIVAGLSQLEPKLPILSEESAELPAETRRSWPAYWLVDPLDGTKEFVKRNGEFTVNIALVVGHELKLGVVYAPVLETTYAAAEGVYCRKCSPDGEADIQVETKARTPLRVVGSRSHAGEALKGYLAKLGEHELLSMGSSLKLCLVAEGAADIYPRLGLTSEWDTAAAQCVVEQAGGKVIELNGEPLRYNAKDELLNPYFLVIADQSRDWLQGL